MPPAQRRLWNMNFKRRGRIFGHFITSALSSRCPYPLRVYVKSNRNHHCHPPPPRREHPCHRKASRLQYATLIRSLLCFWGRPPQYQTDTSLRHQNVARHLVNALLFGRPPLITVIPPNLADNLADNLENFFSAVLLHSFEPCLQRLAPEGLVPLSMTKLRSPPSN